MLKDVTKGITKCSVCQRHFALTIEDHYIAMDPSPKGAFALLTCKEPAREYDAIDCPLCGSQVILQERKPKCPCDYGICDECEEQEEEQEDEHE